MLSNEAVQHVIDAADDTELGDDQVTALLKALDDNYPEVFEKYLDNVVDSMRDDDTLVIHTEPRQ